MVRRVREGDGVVAVLVRLAQLLLGERLDDLGVRVGRGAVRALVHLARHRAADQVDVVHLGRAARGDTGVRAADLLVVVLGRHAEADRDGDGIARRGLERAAHGRRLAVAHRREVQCVDDVAVRGERVARAQAVHHIVHVVAVALGVVHVGVVAGVLARPVAAGILPVARDLEVEVRVGEVPEVAPLGEHRVPDAARLRDVLVRAGKALGQLTALGAGHLVARHPLEAEHVVGRYVVQAAQVLDGDGPATGVAVARGVVGQQVAIGVVLRDPRRALVGVLHVGVAQAVTPRGLLRRTVVVEGPGGIVAVGGVRVLPLELVNALVGYLVAVGLDKTHRCVIQARHVPLKAGVDDLPLVGGGKRLSQRLLLLLHRLVERRAVIPAALGHIRGGAAQVVGEEQVVVGLPVLDGAHVAVRRGCLQRGEHGLVSEGGSQRVLQAHVALGRVLGHARVRVVLTAHPLSLREGRHRHAAQHQAGSHRGDGAPHDEPTPAFKRSHICLPHSRDLIVRRTAYEGTGSIFFGYQPTVRSLYAIRE